MAVRGSPRSPSRPGHGTVLQASSQHQSLFAYYDCFITLSTQHFAILHYTVLNGEGNVDKIVECLQDWVLDFNRTVVNSLVNIANDCISLHLIQIKGLLLLCSKEISHTIFKMYETRWAHGEVGCAGWRYRPGLQCHLSWPVVQCNVLMSLARLRRCSCLVHCSPERDRGRPALFYRLYCVHYPACCSVCTACCIAL